MAHNQDWREWLESLNAAGADYVVVGGIALAHHGVVRYTGDIDVLIHATPGNAQRVLNALQAFGLGSVQLTTMDLCVPDRVVQLGFPPGRIDILTSIDGIGWDEVAGGAVHGDYAGVPVRFISREHLARNKRACGRPQDLADLDRLES
ncbi:MAG: hypothetical protein RLZZ558_478 [Planctomycetota bacterium]|jgi:hypothetical protein